jgi:hydrogenase expression/formation protein HypE
MRRVFPLPTAGNHVSDDANSGGLGCPLPIDTGGRITLAHGGGGSLMQRLIREVFTPAFGRGGEHDGAVLTAPAGRTVVTTDSFVVRPLFFPGGDIGSLAVHGTLNDLAMCGARPLALSAAFIIEEGFEIAALDRIARSMAAAADTAGVAIVTGDTKVVERGHGDGVYVTTSGTGVLEHPYDIHPRAIRNGDVVLLNGDLGRHGMAVMTARDDLPTEPPIATDSANLWPAVAALLSAGIAIHCLRDLTRGGLGGNIVELAEAARLDIELDEHALPVGSAVAAVCELLGLDPLYVANEGRFVAVVPATDAQRAREILRGVPGCEGTTLAGTVGPGTAGRVRLRTRFGTLRHIAMLSGEQLPRIC